MSKTKTSKKIRLTYQELIEFVNGITHLGSVPIKELDTMICVSKTRKNALSEFKMYNELYKAIAEEKCLKDENGKPILNEKDSFKYNTKSEEMDTISRLEELQQKECEITVYPFNVITLKETENITANLLSSLDKLIIM